MYSVCTIVTYLEGEQLLVLLLCDVVQLGEGLCRKRTGEHGPQTSHGPSSPVAYISGDLTLKHSPVNDFFTAEYILHVTISHAVCTLPLDCTH